MVDGEELYFAKNGACTRNGAVKVGDDKFYVDQGQGRIGTQEGGQTPLRQAQKIVTVQSPMLQLL